ncbi:putative Enoyl-CoA hydratase/3-hydroxyisobutyryl-CoA hydrolase/crotonase [Vibrio nigripulchritudo SFn27]|uniref:3-hydroxyisobutyryl-CoA hydrolase n=1 Tax=Vibrio nigripulchritudo TaxID=28173 RepID=U4KDY9_9VIBR|nr:enoyl-CoA hydratase/isomerase family protein [Vibrio nigripulchritudo]CCN83829.1 putative Enoyl-CoA hydratase/3-hydroxyisobutyryl-CoA hydrolase/crotonase [Vibrio nigripulchritudo BLFn1]CCN87163.1 putative Enoyl-CoA hydratase/3-hydroxyisobutyryl-CoA hydrolase/crotonase [Vibrio nigripulchritudo SFn27]CCN94519.1 putative Enoyl-CoA hydratase/3-hydroxyisobutyryl-CoA hydrolase/crotonase [Vibrio nigripulchritudo ENn2]CCO40915.1 putative Enoyl-CoA hydratase/3-hydroxyisobutyryl-CoA hydrolase/crotonas
MHNVIINKHKTKCGNFIAEVQLNAEHKLNALELGMIQIIHKHLDAWKTDDSIVAILLDGAGDKAFCAGGDIVRLYEAMVTKDSNFLNLYFSSEYQLDYTIHTYPKPIICWGSGITMGGGMGLMNGCSHQIVTETSRLSMPETSIGLYPDAGGSWFLNRVNDGIGLFLGLTGAPINAPDAINVGLADWAVLNSTRPQFLDELKMQVWEDDHYMTVNQVLANISQESADVINEMPTPATDHQAFISEVIGQSNLNDILCRLLAEKTDDIWINRSQSTIQNASPLSISLTYRQLKRARNCSLKEVFQQELALSLACCKHGEFQEGIRALLIDKDNTPRWIFNSTHQVDPGFVDSFFANFQSNSLFSEPSVYSS